MEYCKDCFEDLSSIDDVATQEDLEGFEFSCILLCSECDNYIPSNGLFPRTVNKSNQMEFYYGTLC